MHATFIKVGAGPRGEINVTRKIKINMCTHLFFPRKENGIFSRNLSLKLLLPCSSRTIQLGNLNCTSKGHRAYNYTSNPMGTLGYLDSVLGKLNQQRVLSLVKCCD